MRIKINKKIYMMILSIIIFLSLMTLSGGIGVLKVSAASVTLSNPKKVSDSSMESGQKVTYDCIWFGNYPQSEVLTTSILYTTLSKATGWNSKNEIVINNKKYRRIRKEDATYIGDDPATYYNWPDATSWHYFVYEPIKWRVLKVNGEDAFLLADVVLDAQCYNTILANITWETSTIRSWLNGYEGSSNTVGLDCSEKGFINNAFRSEEQNIIKKDYVKNDANLVYGTDGGNNTYDKIFLLSQTEAKEETFGFSSVIDTKDEAKRSLSSTYAFAMGLYRNNSTNGYSWWRLRSPGDALNVASVIFGYGWIDKNGIYVNNGNYGIRPALHLNLDDTNLYAYAGTVCSDGSKTEVSAPTSISSFSNTVTSDTTFGNNSVITGTGTPTISINKALTISKTGVLKSVKSPKKRTLKITWKKLNGISGYQIYISRKKSFTNQTFQRMCKPKKTSVTVTGLKNKKKYYVKLRPYKKVGKMIYYGNWSKTKSVKIK